MGEVFKGEKAYSRMMSTLFVIIMYSSGMPIMYLNGFIFYAVTYLINKYLLIKFYQKSRTLTRSIPIFTVSFLKVGILLHMATATFMLTNKDNFETRTKFTGVKPLVNVNSEQEDVPEGESSEPSVIKSRLQFMHQ
jgi:hypothetical protein